MKPEDEIKKIVQREKLLDCAEIAELESIRDSYQPKVSRTDSNYRSDTQSRYKYDVLVKIIGWIK